MPELDPADLTRRLRPLQERAARAAHELPADEVRARGQRRRRRRVAVVSVLAVLAVLAVIGSGAIATGAARTLLDADRTPPAGPVPPPSVLPSADELPVLFEGRGWKALQTFVDDGRPLATGLCQNSLTEVGATSVVGSIYDGTIDRPGGSIPTRTSRDPRP
jgi:hypothetical protein